MSFSRKSVKVLVWIALGMLLGRTVAAHAAGTAPSSPIPGTKLFLFSFAGSGPSTSTCDDSGICTTTFNGTANGAAIGKKAAVSSSLSWDTGGGGIVSAGTICYLADGSATITTKSKGQFDFEQVGLLCGPLDGFSPTDFNGDLTLTGGTGKFGVSIGGGSITTSRDSMGFVLLFAEGALTWKGKVPLHN